MAVRAAAPFAGGTLHLAAAAPTEKKVPLRRQPPAAARGLSQASGHPYEDRLPVFNVAAFDLASAPDLGLHARSALLVDLDRSEVLWLKNPHLALPPASLTKLMTAIVASDLAGMDSKVTVSPAAAAAEPSRMGLTAGQVLTVRELLYGALLNSGNDAACALGDGIVPLDRFLYLMNQKAAYLHLRDTRFTTPNGLTDAGNRTSAYDLAVVAAYITRSYPELAVIAGTRDYVIPAADAHPAFYPHNLNHFLAIYPGATGLKTGFTDDARGCLVATATRGGRHLLLVLMGSDIMFGDGVRLMDYGFEKAR